MWLIFMIYNDGRYRFVMVPVDSSIFLNSHKTDIESQALAICLEIALANLGRPTKCIV